MLLDPYTCLNSSTVLDKLKQRYQSRDAGYSNTPNEITSKRLVKSIQG